MGKESHHESMISRTWWSLTLRLSTTLEQAEREAVLGDLAQCGESGSVAFRGVLGLVARRQAALWNNWRMWMLFAVLLPFTFALSTVSGTAAHESAVYTWMYVNNWDWSLVKNSGFWYVFREAATGMLMNWLLLACWAWSVGFILGKLPKQLSAASRFLLFLLLGLNQLTQAPQRFTLFLMSLSGLPRLSLVPAPDARMTTIDFYQLLFSWMVLAIVVALPANRGMRDGQLASTLHVKPRISLLIGAVLATLTLFPQTPFFGLLLLGGPVRQWFLNHRGAIQMAPWLAYWPTFYLIVIGLSRRWRTNVGLE